ncbi:hypothetical protein CALVIDRAFT_601459 [Calocera viscosa TUFC12733]|uniref:Uncharacterized protein n=1 Tax=Calocera viscosa (strain TUFC12733) TaxID=1330018 RepID=A0A167IAK8_CALVF|nr:hypothetical protein CALVIDRAFT_601459 [Calocera viscosa TUFC12733]
MHDLPTDMVLSDTERAELSQCGTEHPHSISYGYSRNKTRNPATLYNYATQHYHGFINAQKTLRTAVRDLHGAPKIAVEKTYLGYGFDSGKPLVLRNLSKKRYVRSGAVDVLNEQIFAWYGKVGFSHGAQDGAYCLGDALVCRICWSSDGSTSMTEAPDDLTCGPWAGDRFDVITQDEFGEKEDRDQWHDASEGNHAIKSSCNVV